MNRYQSIKEWLNLIQSKNPGGDARKLLILCRQLNWMLSKHESGGTDDFCEHHLNKILLEEGIIQPEVSMAPQEKIREGEMNTLPDVICGWLREYKVQTTQDIDRLLKLAKAMNHFIRQERHVGGEHQFTVHAFKYLEKVCLDEGIIQPEISMAPQEKIEAVWVNGKRFVPE